MSPIHISLRAETLFSIGNFFPVSNSMLTTWIVMAGLIFTSVRLSSNLKKIPGSLQSIFEILIGSIYDLLSEILHDKTKRYFPFLMTIFIFIISLNWFGLLPGVGTVGLYEEGEKVSVVESVKASDITKTSSVQEDIHAENQEATENITSHEDNQSSHATEGSHKILVPLFRSGSADLNFTLALAILAMTYVQIAGFSSLGLSYLKKFFNFSNPIYTFVGILELISEFAKIISFAFRLFGNIFAGEVLLTVIAFLVPIIAPLPFLGLEIFVGFIQALVFTLLSAVFLSTAAAPAEH